jgi:hypothetical protein
VAPLPLLLPQAVSAKAVAPTTTSERARALRRIMNELLLVVARAVVDPPAAGNIPNERVFRRVS